MQYDGHRPFPTPLPPLYLRSPALSTLAAGLADKQYPVSAGLPFGGDDQYCDAVSLNFSVHCLGFPDLMPICRSPHTNTYCRRAPSFHNGILSPFSCCIFGIAHTPSYYQLDNPLTARTSRSLLLQSNPVKLAGTNKHA